MHEMVIHVIYPDSSDYRYADRDEYERISSILLSAYYKLKLIKCNSPVNIRIWYEFDDGKIRCSQVAGNASFLRQISEAIK